MLIAMYNEVKKNPTPQKMLELTQVILPHVTTNLNLIEILSITSSMMESELKEIKTLSLPIEGSYKYASDKGRSVLYVEFELNIKALHRFIYGN
ncbi:hypothetical protein AGMMS49992_33020 [Clostridia bacterium]|nr:hypothetical protein AGMMS49992_33020 [Clostridia bacterium]